MIDKFINKYYNVLVYTIIWPLAIIAIAGFIGFFYNAFKYGF